jgi:hypothetical protein
VNPIPVATQSTLEARIGVDNRFWPDWSTCCEGGKSSFFPHPYCQTVEWLATTYAAKLALKVFPWISTIVFAVVLSLFFEPLRDDVTHARIDICVEDLKSVSDGYSSESKAAALRVRRCFAFRPRAEES